MKDRPRVPRLEPEDYYFDADGRMAFTRAYHLKRGTCCESGCRHCPWGYAAKRAAKKMLSSGSRDA